MTRLARCWHSHRVLSAMLVALLLLRALIPAGYMPSGERPFTLQMCPGTFPAHLLPPAQPALAEPEAQAPPEDRAHHLHHAHHIAPPVAPDAPNDHAQHGGSHHPSASAESCAFGGAPSVGPALQLAGTFSPSFDRGISLPEFSAASAPTKLRFRLQQPRAPPVLS